MITDKHGKPLHKGDAVRFHSTHGTVFNAVVYALIPQGERRKVSQRVAIQIVGDPYPVPVRARQVELITVRRRSAMPVKTKAPAKKAASKKTGVIALRSKARELGVEDIEDMDADELKAAIDAVEAEEDVEDEDIDEDEDDELDDEDEDEEDEEEDEPAPKRGRASSKNKTVAKSTRKTSKTTKATPKRAATSKTTSQKGTKATSKTKASAKKAPAKRAAREIEPGENPYRETSNSFRIAELLIAGGTEGGIIAKLVKLGDAGKLALKEAAVERWGVENMVTSRLRLVKRQLRDTYGFEIEEGEDSKGRKTVKAVPAE